jgi:hypothetical protein
MAIELAGPNSQTNSNALSIFYIFQMYIFASRPVVIRYISFDKSFEIIKIDALCFFS